MKVKRNENIIEYNGTTANLDEVINTLASKDSKMVAGFLVEKASLPRELRTNALRYVLNDYVKIAKELVLSDEYTYRLNWYDKFSEYQLINFWNVLKTSNYDKFNEGLEASRFKKVFYLLLLLNSDAVGFSDDELQELLALKTLSGDDESFNEFMTELDPAFYDYDYNFDGMSYEDFKTNLKRSSTVADIRNLASKYDINVPKRLKKEELVNLVADGLRRQGKYNDDTLPTLKKMSAISLQRFAKVNHIKASTEMKKEDIVDYIMNRIESSPKAIHKQRIELVSIPELEEFKFTKDYLREVKIVEEFDDEDTMEEAPVVEESPVVEPEKVEEPVIEETKEPAPEPTPVPTPEVEEVVLEDEKNLDELVSQLEVHIEEEHEPTPEPIPEPAPEPTPVKEEKVTKDYDKELNELENRPESVYSDELLQTIVRILEERDSKDVVTELLDDNRFNSVIKMYEERISYLEKTINDMRTTPVPINIQVTYPNVVPPYHQEEVKEAPVVQEVKDTNEPIGNDDTQIITEEQNEELEKAPEAIVSNEDITPAEPEEVGLEPIVYDSTFDSLTDEEKANAAKNGMEESKHVEIEIPTKKEEKQSKRLKKLEKKADKLEKMRTANDRALYKRRRRRAVRKTIFTIILILLILAIALTVTLLLIDNGTFTGNFADQIDKYVSYVPFLKKGAPYRETILKWYQTAADWIKGVIGNFKK